MNNNRLIVISVALMLGVTIFACLSRGTALANNCKDISYHLAYSGSGIVNTNVATKTDSTSVYIKHAGETGVTVGIGVSGYSGNYTGMNGSGGFVSVPLNKGYKITNYVVESFQSSYNQGICKNIYLMLKGSGAATLHGVWSPDSV